MPDYIKKIFEEKEFWPWIFNVVMSIAATFVISAGMIYHYAEKNAIGNKEIAQLSSDVKELKTMEKNDEKDHQDLLLDNEKLESQIHAMDLRFTSLTNQLSNTTSYQQVLRNEVKNNAEEKLNKADYWRIMNPVLIRIRYLEEHQSKTGARLSG